MDYDKMVGFDQAGEEEYPGEIEDETLIEAMVPEVIPFAIGYQRFIMLSSRNKDHDKDREFTWNGANDDIIKVFFLGEEIEVNAHQLVRAISAVTGQQFGSF